VLDQGWVAVTTGINRTADRNIPDEVGIDEDSNGSINNWYSIYTKAFPAGTFQLKQADNTGRNMYGAVITVKDGDSAKAGQVLATWDPHTHPVVTEVAGLLKLESLLSRRPAELSGG